jgi:hypothetical protein
MRTITLSVLAVAALPALLTATPSQADPYKWCAIYGGGLTAPKNCGFVTLAQCRETVSGVGGYCEPNPFYTGPERKSRRGER